MGTQRWPDTYKERRNWRERRSARVGDALDGLLGALDAKGARKLVRLWDHWAEVVGEEIASLAKPLGRRGKALVLQTEDPMVSQHLSFLVPQLLGTVNSFLGQPLFEDVRFELSDGRPALDRVRPGPPQSAATPPKRPENLGKAADKIDPNTPLGRAYRAYLEMFEDQEKTSG